MPNRTAPDQASSRLGSGNQPSFPEVPKVRRDEPSPRHDFDFDEILDEMNHDLGEESHREKEALASVDESRAANHLDKSIDWVNRAIQELDSGVLDEFVVNQLLQFDRTSAEFRQEYLRLRVESLIDAQIESIPSVNSQTGAHPTAMVQNMDRESPRSPWEIYRLRDLWSFFGPWLTIVAALQFYASMNLCKLLEDRDMLPYATSPYLVSVLPTCLLLTISALYLRSFRGKHFHRFVPHLLGITGVSAIAAISLHALIILYK